MKTLAIFSDGHSNSIVGLTKPTVYVNDGDRLAAGAVRSLIFRTWESLLEEVDKKRKGELLGCLNGDSIEIDGKDRTFEVLARNRDVVLQNAVEVYEPFFQMCKRVWVVTGTEAHVGKRAELESAFADNFGNAVRNKETQRRVWDFLPLVVEGVRFDIAHHPAGGGGGGRPFNSQTAINRIATDTLFEYANAREELPHIVVRSHLHRYRDSRDNFAVRAIITPPLSMLTAYARRIGINRENELGGILVYCHGGEYEVEPLIRKPRKTQWQVVK